MLPLNPCGKKYFPKWGREEFKEGRTKCSTCLSNPYFSSYLNLMCSCLLERYKISIYIFVMVWMSVSPPKFWSQWHLGGGAPGGWLDHQGKALMNETPRRHHRELIRPLCHGRKRQEGCNLKDAPQPCWHPDLNFQAPELWEINFFCS